MKRTSISFLAACSMMAAPLVLAQTAKLSPEPDQDKAVFTYPAGDDEILKAITLGRYCGPVRVSPKNGLLKHLPLVSLWVYDMGLEFPAKYTVSLSYLESLLAKLPEEDEDMKRGLGRVIRELTKTTKDLETGKLLKRNLMSEEAASRTDCVPISSLPLRAAHRAPA